MHNSEEHHIVRIRGLPWSVTEDEIIEFFNNCNIKGGSSGIHITKNREDRPSGDAYVELESEDDIKDALKLNNKTMGKRYIEVFRAKHDEMEWMLKKGNNQNRVSTTKIAETFECHNDYVVRLRGLPFEAGSKEIEEFFVDLTIAPNGILFTKDRRGRPSGQAYVVFTSNEDLELAMSRNNCNIGHRYIEVFKSDKDEALMEARAAKDNSTEQLLMAGHVPFGRGGSSAGGGPVRGGRGFGRAGPYDRPSSMGGRVFGPMMMMGGGLGAYGRVGRSPLSQGMDYSNDFIGGGYNDYDDFSGNSGGGYFGYSGSGGGAFAIRMRGLPFNATARQIMQWFAPTANAMDVEFEYNNMNRPNGNATVLFATEREAREALKKDREHIGSRYVELFYEGPVSGGF